MIGTALHDALAAVGVTQQRVERWLGQCCCAERRRKLDALGNWAAKALKTKVELARGYLTALLED